MVDAQALAAQQGNGRGVAQYPKRCCKAGQWYRNRSVPQRVAAQWGDGRGVAQYPKDACSKPAPRNPIEVPLSKTLFPVALIVQVGRLASCMVSSDIDE